MACSSCGGKTRKSVNQDRRDSLVGKTIVDNNGKRYNIVKDKNGKAKAIPIP